MKERRRAVRLKAAFDVEYSSKDPIEISAKTKTKDISALGMRISINRLIKKGAKLVMQIKPADWLTPIMVYGRVVWAKEALGNPSGDVDAGIEFTKIDISERNELLREAAGFKKI